MKINFEEHVRPIFREHCFTCHSQDTAKSDLALDNFSAVMQGGASGEIIVPGELETSRLWMLVSHQESPEMPPEQAKLADEKLEIIKQWILGGALETSGSTAKINKPKIDLALSAGSGKPEGPIVLPEGLSHQPIVFTPRAPASAAIAGSPWAPVVAIAGHKQIVLYHTETLELLGVLPFPEGVAHVLKFSRSGALLLAGGGQGGQAGVVAVYDVRTGERVMQVGDELDTVLAADINNDHSMIALGGPRRVVRLYSTSDGSLISELKKHTEWITAIEFSPDGVLLATGDRNGGMFVWESETAREYQNLAGHGGAITDIAWRLDSNLLASISEDTTIRLWEMENGSQVRNWGAHGGGGSAIDFTHDGRIASAGRDRQVRIWDQNGSQLIACEPFSDLALEVAFSHDGSRVIGGDWAGEHRIWNVADGKLLAPLAANPPTLAMVEETALAQLAQATAAAEKAAADLAAAQAALAEKTTALEAAAKRLADAANDADKAAAQADLDRLTAEKTAAEQAVATATAAAQAAADQAAAAGARVDQVKKERAVHDSSQTAQASS